MSNTCKHSLCKTPQALLTLHRRTDSESHDETMHRHMGHIMDGLLFPPTPGLLTAFLNMFFYLTTHLKVIKKSALTWEHSQSQMMECAPGPHVMRLSWPETLY